MNCLNCGKTDNKVIDSRLSKDEVVIRRRRECLICSGRFTTYESIEELVLPLLIKRRTEHVTTTTGLRALLSLMSNTLKILSKETEKHIDRVDKLLEAQTVEAEKRLSKKRQNRYHARNRFFNNHSSFAPPMAHGAASGVR